MRIATLLAVAFHAAAPLGAQELLTLRDGSRLEGTVAERAGGLLVASPLGRRQLARDEVQSRESAEPLRARFESHRATRPASLRSARVALARWCFEQGLTSGCIEELEAALQMGAIEDEGAMQLAGRLSAQWQVHPGEDADKGRDRREYLQGLFRDYAARGFVQAAIAYHRVEPLREDPVFRLAMGQLRSESESARFLGATVAGAYRSNVERVAPLYRRSLADPSGTVRHASVRSLAGSDDPAFARLYAKNLDHGAQRVRMHAAEALGNLGAMQGAAPLIAALRATAGATVPRNHIAVTTQRAYVKDFDVEVAAGAVIADPVVDIVQDGAVLDVAAVAISIERTIYVQALKRLAGRDFGFDVAKWEAWLAGQ